jgi:hypothetical protein
MAAKTETTGDADRIFDQLQFENVLAEREQREIVRGAEIDFLDATETHAELCQAMKDKQGLMAQPELLADEMSYRDFRIWRLTEGK